MANEAPEVVQVVVRTDAMDTAGSYELPGGQGINAYVAAVPADTTVTMQLNAPVGTAYDLHRFPQLRGPCGSDFGRVRVSWSASTGNTLQILFGKDIDASVKLPT